MNYKTDSRILNIKTSLAPEDISIILKRPWFKVVKRENTPLWESLIQAGGAMGFKEIGFVNPMRDLYALDYDKYADNNNFEALKKYFIEQCEKDASFLTNFFSNLEKTVEEFDVFVTQHQNVVWDSLSDKALADAYDTFINYSLETLTFLWPPLAPEEWIVEKISGEMSKHIDPIKESERFQIALHLLIASTIPSLLQEKEHEILKLAQEIGNVENIKKFESAIESIYKKYAWLNDHSLKFEYESKEQFNLALQNAIATNPHEKLLKINEEKNRTVRERERLIKDLHFSSEYIQYADQAAKIPHWRLLRTEKSVEAAYKMQGMFKELNKRLGLENVLLCYYWEIGKFLDGAKIEKVLITNRKDGYGLMITGQAIYDLDLESRTTLKSGIESKIKLGNAIKGNVACRGFVKGRVRILHNTKQLSSFKEGEILVTAMTTPEYVPVMKLASAIVTDEGGISCHAAIVSRELKIPCVIGTKTATKILKDGDMVEVDAVKGIVTIIK